MENQESKSSWDDLARDLGAEVSPETQQREEAAAAAAHSEPPLSRKPEPEAHAPLPKRSATNWNSLAVDLGLPPSAEPEPVAAAEPAVPEPPRQEYQPEPRRREREESSERRPARRDREGQQRERQDRDRPPRRGDRDRS